MSTSADVMVTRRPGGRTAEVTQRVHQAIVDLLVEGGVQACTFSAVAERAAIERSTLYRRFPDRWDAILDALTTHAGLEVMPDPGDSFAEELNSVLRKVRNLLDSALGTAVIALSAELRTGRQGENLHAFFGRRMEQLGPMFDAAIKRGELASDVDRLGLFSMASGAVYFRMFIAGEQVDDPLIARIVGDICRLHCAQ